MASWQPFIENKKVSLKDIGGRTYEEVCEQKLDDYLKQFEKESLLTKVDRLFQVCRPPSVFSPIKNFLFNN